MQKIFETVIGGVYCWEIWSCLFAPPPYGNPYIAMLAGGACLLLSTRFATRHTPHTSRPAITVSGDWQLTRSS